MTLDLNNKHLGTVSQKFRRVVPLKNYIVDKINNDQEIKRLARYMTITPIMNKGKTYDGKIINQPDLINGLNEISVDDKNIQVAERILYNCAFTEDVLEERRLTIYVHSPRRTFNLNIANGKSNYGSEEYTGKYIFYVEIVYPLEYNEIEPYGNERANAIACRVADMLDDMYVDEDMQEVVGAVRFTIEGEVIDQRLSRSGYMILSIPLSATVFTKRIDSNKVEN